MKKIDSTSEKDRNGDYVRVGATFMRKDNLKRWEKVAKTSAKTCGGEKCGKKYRTNKEKETNQQMKKIDSTSEKDRNGDYVRVGATFMRKDNLKRWEKVAKTSAKTCGGEK
ncbi:hypothetical protein GOBAR_AA29189 [Gossypium barbadense]|uniref:Uncharacterized protein n=1 Tax=Gossypium barbadense TaxID=3634 RepID=A0A2P5WKB9_GOSBA|nr:hypothetical protein GOBAR_AA29189 [Gossypium barbadense]